LLPIVRKDKAARRLHSIADLAGESWILNPEGCSARAALRGALRGAGITMRVAVETYTYDLQLALVAEGRGLGLVPARLLARSAIRSRIRALPIRPPGFELTIWSVHRVLSPDLERALGLLCRGLRDELRPA